MGGNPPYRFSVSPSDQQLRFGVTEERVLSRRDEFDLLGANLRHSMRFACGEGIANVNEGCPPFLVADLLDYYIFGAHPIAPYQLFWVNVWSENAR